jgi:subtilisin family serine protease
VTLFLHTGPMRKQARGVLCAAVVLAALLVTSWPSWAASPADLAGPLRDIAAMDRAGRLSPADPFAKLVGVRGDGRVLVDILFTRPAAGEIGNLTRLGARLHRQSDVRAEAIVPVSRLVDVACLPNVAQVCVPDRPVPLQIGPTVSEGVQLTNALSLQVSGITGLGVSVAIIDEGFLDYDTAELPPNVVTRSFRSDGVINGISDHGTAVAEIVADMAPNVSMYLLAVGTSMDVESALQYCIQNDIDIANISLGFLAGPFDGLAALDKAVNRARLAGVLPVVSSGNFAQRHWAGDYVDADGDSLMEFASQDEGATITTTVANEQVQAYLSWFETASAQGTRADLTDRDYDIELVDPTGVIIASSAVTQNGNDPPTETLLAIAPTAGSYDLRVRAKSANISTGPTDHFQFFVWTQDLESTLQVPETSLSVPGTAAGALSVGATRAVATLPAPIMNYPVDTLEPFSSQGPTVDGRQKPEMSGPDYVQTSTSLNPFPGTSAAAPHVAGGAALLKSEDQTRTPDELVDVLVRQLAAAQNLVSPIKLIDGKNASIDEAGAGRLSLRSGLDTKPPSISITFPLNGTTITTAQPTVVGVITDTETGVDQTTIELTLDGATVQWDSFNPSSGVVTYTPPAALTRAAHTVTLVASDNAGNAGAVAVANFRVGLPTLSAGLHLISLPYRNLKDPDPASIFGIAQSEVALARWVPTDTGFSKYRLWPDRYATFEPADCTGANPTVDSPPAGLGYFVNLPREVVLNVAGESLSDVSSYTIQLPLGTAEPTGWHMIGNPYQDTVDWSTVQFITHGVRQDLDTAIANGVTGGIIYEYVPGSGATGGYYDFTTPQSAALKPMTGYWLHVLTSTAVVIYPSTVTGSKTASKQAAESPKVSLENWKLQLVASAPGLRDPCNYLGVAATASSGYDVASDVPEPPPLGQTLRLYFPHPEWKTAGGEYAQDLRARSATAQSWAFEVACPTPGQRVTLTWPDLNASVPGELAIRLKDLDSGRAAFMRTTSSYSFKAPDAGVRHFEITAERAGAGGLQITALAAAPARDGSIAVSYELSTAASVTAEVRNIVGRPIRSLVVDRSTAKGTQTLTWDTRNEAGVRVPAGTYLLQLTAKTPDGQAVRRVCPVNAVR